MITASILVSNKPSNSWICYSNWTLWVIFHPSVGPERTHQHSPWYSLENSMISPNFDSHESVWAYLSGNVLSILPEDAAAQEHLAEHKHQHNLRLVPAGQSETRAAFRQEAQQTQRRARGRKQRARSAPSRQNVDIKTGLQQNVKVCLTCRKPAPGRPFCRCAAAGWRSDGWSRRRRWWRRWAGQPTAECWSPAGALDRPSLSVQPADTDRNTDRETIWKEKKETLFFCQI